MKRVIVSMNITLDGYISGPNHELDWHFGSWRSDMGERLGLELTRADTMLLGRTTYLAMAGYWLYKAKDYMGPREEIAIADLMNSIHKVVYTSTLTSTHWNNTSFINGHIKTAINKLKKGNGTRDKSIMVYGSAQLVHALIEYDLVDEYQLWVHPVVLGKGNQLFNKIKQPTALKLMGTTTFQSGVVLMDYQL